MAVLDPGVPGVAQLGRIGRPDMLDPLLLTRQAEERRHNHHALPLSAARRRAASPFAVLPAAVLSRSRNASKKI